MRKNNKKKPLLVACDVYRPAAIDQLKQIGKELGIEVYSEGKGNPVEISKNAIIYAKENGFDYVLIDTAGRSHKNREQRDDIERLIMSVPEEEREIYLVLSLGKEKSAD